MPRFARFFKLLISLTITLVVCGLLSSCARKTGAYTNDPDEAFNRKLYAFNQVADDLVLRPVTVVYTHTVPSFMRHGVHNFFNNLDEVTNICNDLLQAKGTYALNDSWRFIFNTTIGFAGTVDAAKSLGLPPHEEDFGLTLAAWGAKYSYFSETPILGPSTYRDAVATPFDWFLFSAWPHISPRGLDYTLLTLWAVDQRAQLLPADQLIQQSFDPYIFVRNAYMSMRAKEVTDNNMPYQQYREQFLAQAGLHHANGNGSSNTGNSGATNGDNGNGGIITIG